MASMLSRQPLAEQQAGARQVRRDLRRLQPVDGLLEIDLNISVPGQEGAGNGRAGTSAQSVPLATARSERRSSANCARLVSPVREAASTRIRQAPASQVGQVFFVDREQVGHRALVVAEPDFEQPHC